MNHVLDYKGFRFFQSSYDRDEKGSILSVNFDPGTLPTISWIFINGNRIYLGVFIKEWKSSTAFKK